MTDALRWPTFVVVVLVATVVGSRVGAWMQQSRQSPADIFRPSLVMTRMKDAASVSAHPPRAANLKMSRRTLVASRAPPSASQHDESRSPLLQAYHNGSLRYLSSAETSRRPSTGPAYYHPVPLFASPILLFKKGLPYRPGEAPSVASMFAHSLESVRMVDTEVPIFLITNFEPTAADSRLLRRLNVTRLDAEETLGSEHGEGRALLRKFVSRCPLSGNLFATATVLRYFYLLSAMRQLAVRSLFFLEGDNLLLRSVRELAALYGMGTLRAHASHSHVSLHASFMSVDFVRALADYAARFVERQHKCPFDGGGQDMALSYEATLALNVELRRRGALLLALAC